MRKEGRVKSEEGRVKSEEGRGRKLYNKNGQNEELMI